MIGKHFHQILYFYVSLCHYVSTKKFQKHLFGDILQNRVVKIFAKFTEQHLCWSLFLIKLQPSGLELFLKKKLQHRCFPLNFVKFIRTPFFTEHLQTTASEICRVSFLRISFCLFGQICFGKCKSQNFICLKEQRFC